MTHPQKPEPVLPETPRTRVGADLQTDFAQRMSYGDYLQLDTLLAAHKPLTQKHDERLFITIHQVQELWLNLVTHELEAAMVSIRHDDLPGAFKSLARVTRIQEQLIQAWDVLSTMTPSDYLSFRDELGQSSGFQSFQYRLVEFRLGAKDRRMMLAHRHRPEIHERLERALSEPSLYDEALRLLARRGLPVPADLVERDFSVAHQFDERVRDLWLTIYRDPSHHFDLYQLAEELVDVEDWFQQWRFRHMKTVERIIGLKRGTGGSSGVAFLKTALDRSFFPELWELRTHL